jgi:hypothetical protein
MALQPICNAIGAAILLGVTVVAGCGSDAGSSAIPIGPSGQLGAKKDDPPPRPQTKEECDACKGLWAVHGILPTKSCICATSDAGERCVDGRQCIGQCLVKEGAEFQVMEHTDPPRGFYVGTCSPYDTTFGCNRVIPSGIDERLPLASNEAALTLCID